MSDKPVEKWQAQKITAGLFPGFNYLHRLGARMEKAGFTHDSELFRHVCAAYDAMHRLNVKVRYLACGLDAPITVAPAARTMEEDDMCGRFVRAKPAEFYSDIFGVPDVPKLFASYNVAPTQQILALRVQDNAKVAVALRWGLIPSWDKDKKAPFINARGETVADKPAFRAAFKKRRCLIVADGYYEWKKLDVKMTWPGSDADEVLL